MSLSVRSYAHVSTASVAKMVDRVSRGESRFKPDVAWMPDVPRAVIAKIRELMWGGKRPNIKGVFEALSSDLGENRLGIGVDGKSSQLEIAIMADDLGISFAPALGGHLRFFVDGPEIFEERFSPDRLSRSMSLPSPDYDGILKL